MGMLVQPNYTLIRDSAIPTFEQISDELEIRCKVHKTDYTVTLADNIKVLLRSGEEAEKIVASNLAFGVIDEPGKQHESVGVNVLARIRDPRARLQQLVLTGTPEGKNWFYEWTTSPGTDWIKSTTYENPYLTEEYIQSLISKMTYEQVQAYIHGEFVSFEAGWYSVVPKILVHRNEGAIKIYKEPHQVSDQLIIGIDTSGGLGRDSTVVALIDKRDRSLVAFWSDNRAVVDQGADIAEKLFNMYSQDVSHVHANIGVTVARTEPTVMVEVNGIGLPMWQKLISKGVPARQIKTTEAKRYSFMLASKQAVESGYIEGPEELSKEAELLVTKDGNFKGPKDASMAIGFCLKELEESPYEPPKPNHKIFNMNFKSNRQVTV
jgi:hypothetical protein